MTNDLISREALKKALHNFFDGKIIDEPTYILRDVFCYIDNAPTVEVPENAVNCVLTMFGKCSYNKTGCSDCEIKDKIRKALNERPIDNWIPVNERLPEYSGLYLISVDDVVTVANFTGTYFMHRGGGRVEVYAWQPLPEPYKKGGA